MTTFQRRVILSMFFFAFGMFFLTTAKASAKPGDAYSPEKAIAYADSCFKKENGTYVANPSTKYGRELCAGYVSQCLREGGMTEDSSWYWHGIGKTPDAWRVSNSLYNYLKKSGYPLVNSPKTSDVKPGDVIFYRTNSGWGHCAICTGKTENGTPLINAYNNPHCHYSNWTLNYSGICVFSMTNKTQAPEISAEASKDGKEVTLSCVTSDADIYYTTNGKTPTKSSTHYKSAITLKKSAEIKAIAISQSKSKSDVSSLYINVEKPIADGTYLILPSTDTAKTLGIASASTAEGAAITLSKKSEDYNSKFTFSYIKSGYYHITLFHSGKALTEVTTTKEVSVPAPSEGTVITKGVADSQNTVAEASENVASGKISVVTETSYSICQKKLSATAKNQQWKLVCKGKGLFYLKNAATSHLLTLDAALSTGKTVYPDAKNAKKAQIFSIVPTVKPQITLKNETVPKSLKLHESFFIYGNITSNYILSSVSIVIQDKNGKKLFSTSAAPKKTTYDLHNLSAKVKFRTMDAGSYIYLVKAEDETGLECVLVEQSFKISK